MFEVLRCIFALSELVVIADPRTMPASDFGWSNRAQVFQVFGNKRKHEWTEAGDREVQVIFHEMGICLGF